MEARQAMTAQKLAQDKKKVIVVDDDSDFQKLVHMMLSSGDVEIIPAQNGQGAMEAIRTQRPDLVILDLMLPDMNGWEVFMQMRGDDVSSQIPVIILSGLGTRHDRTFSLRVAKVHDYLTKPCLPSRLRESVASALHH